MNKKDLFLAFLRGDTKGRASNLEIVGNNLFNWKTVIARRQGKKVLLNTTYYSPTTKKNTTILRKLIPSSRIVEVVHNNINACQMPNIN
jgi:Cu/Ag efflux protein CusF